MKKYRINDILSDNTSGQQNSQQTQPNGGIDRQFQSLGHLGHLGQRLQFNQNLQNRIQRRYEADGSEEEEMQRQNQLLSTPHSGLPPQPFGPSLQRNVSSGSGEEISNLSNIDANSLYHKLKELQEAEQRLKQVEDLMRSIEKMENNIKEVKRDSVVNDSRKASNEMQTKFISRNNVTKPHIKSVSTQPKQLTTNSANNISISNPQKNIIPRNIEENNGSEMNFAPNANPTQHLMSQSMDFCDNNLGYSTDVDESESNSEESFNLINGNLIRSMRSQFDSMRSQFENMFPALENQLTNGNININQNLNPNNQNSGNSSNNYINNQNSGNGSNNYINNQFFHLMVLQNYQILQQQQMLLLWLQQQQNHCQSPHLSHPQPIPEPQRLQSHNPHHYMNGRQTNITSIPQNSIHYRNTTLSSVRNNDSNGHNMTALNNQVVPGVRANNYWDNFKSYSRQNKLSASANRKTNENLSVGHNQMVSPILTTDQQIIQNTNQCPDLNSLSPNSTLVRHPFGLKAANASHVTHGQCAEHVEKQQNLPQFNEMTANKTIHSQHSDGNNFAALFSMLEKLIENDDKYSSKCVPKKKSTNLVMTSDNEEECGAVGGVGVTNIVNNQISSEESTESANNTKSSQQSSGSSRCSMSANMSIPLHIPASSGAIRKKPRNQEILELSSKTENSESFTKSSVNSSELIRPLMAAEGRSCETGLTNTGPPQKTHQILSIRPPTTGAPPNDCESDGSNASSDEQLAEEDQTVSELMTSEAEVIHNNNNIPKMNPLNANTIQTNTMSAQTIETTQRLLNEENPIVSNDNSVEEEEEEEDDDNLLGNQSNEGAIRLSGDGEQGL